MRNYRGGNIILSNVSNPIILSNMRPFAFSLFPDETPTMHLPAFLEPLPKPPVTYGIISGISPYLSSLVGRVLCNNPMASVCRVCEEVTVRLCRVLGSPARMNAPATNTDVRLRQGVPSWTQICVK